MIIYSGEEIKTAGCPGCAYAKHEFELPCGIAFENENFVLSQDWELPILGFLIVSPKKHVEKLEELSRDERNEMFDIVDKAIKILRKNRICDRFEVIFEEKENRHFHIWIMPRHDWMNNLVDDIIDNIGIILEYAKQNFRTEEVIEKIKEINLMIKKEFSDN